MRFLSPRQQLLFAQATDRATRPQPLMTRNGKEVARADRVVVQTGQPSLTKAKSRQRKALGAPAISSSRAAVENRSQSSTETAVETEREHRRFRSLFELAGTGIMLALFLAVAIFA